jgi:hypothetical protein
MFFIVAGKLRRANMRNKKKKKISQIDLIKSVRRELPPSGKTFRVKKKESFRDRKHKGKIDITTE